MARRVRQMVGHAVGAAVLGSSLAWTMVAAQEPVGMASVRGRVLHTQTGLPLAGAIVAVQGTTSRTVTTDDGRFVLMVVPLGERTLRFTAIGFSTLTRTITVGTEGGVVEVTMSPLMSIMDEIVITATGARERREVANAVATVNVDSIARIAAASSVDHVLTARVPGVSVRPQSGLSGGSFSVRVRGANSIQLANEPLWIVDGIRLDSRALTASRNLWDNIGLAAINPGDIETLDVIKGPAAAALYGTEAANGVVVITTRRGVAGQTRWRATIEQGVVEQPAAWPDNFWSWGRNIAGGVPQAAPVQCRIANVAAGRCVIDSLTTFNPLRNRQTSPYADPGSRTQAGLQVTGGTERVRFLASAEREAEQGPYTMPDAEIARLRESRGSAPREDQVHPNTLDQFNLRGNFSATLSPELDLTVSSAYTDRQLQTPFSGNFDVGIQSQAVLAPGYRTAFGGYLSERLGDIMSLQQVDEEGRLFVSASANWNPRAWLAGRLTTGIDRAGSRSRQFTQFGEGPTGPWTTGIAAQGGGRVLQSVQQQTVTSDLLVTASRTVTDGLDVRTALGGQYVVKRSGFLQGSGVNLSPGAQTVGAGTVLGTTEEFNEDATLGLYLEQGLSWRNRTFLTFGVRTDRNSQFGKGYPRVWYPRAGLSWVVSEEQFFPQWDAITKLRLRTAWGRAGIPPGATTALRTLSAGTVLSGGQVLPTLQVSSLGNPDLRPEVVSETEFGFDLQLWHERLSIEATRYEKRSRDGIAFIALPPSLGTATVRVDNVSSVRNRGTEVALDGTVIEVPAWSWNIRLSGATLENKVLDLGSVAQPFQTFRVAEGYSLHGLWSRPITGYNDANGDGILEATEITSDTTWRYLGPTLPTREWTATTTLNLVRYRVALMVMVDHRGGHYRWWALEQDRCNSGNCRAVNDPSAPLADQAAAVAVLSAAHRFTTDGYLKPADFVRLREVSVTLTLPHRIAALMRAREASVVVAGRNLAMLSTRYPGLDAEGTVAPFAFFAVQDSRFGIPPLRYWIARMNLGF